MTRTAGNEWEAFYEEDGGGFVSLGTNTFDHGLPMNMYYGIAAKSNGASLVDTDFKVLSVSQTTPLIYWDTQEAIYDNQTFDASTIDWSSFAAASESGTVKYDYSTDGGSTYTGTWRTVAQMQALSNPSAVLIAVAVASS